MKPAGRFWFSLKLPAGIHININALYLMRKALLCASGKSLPKDGMTRQVPLVMRFSVTIFSRLFFKAFASCLLIL